MHNGAAVRQWAHGLVERYAAGMEAALAGVCRKPRSAKRVHAARRSIARLQAAIADLKSIVGDVPLEARAQELRRRAGKVRDADVLCKRLKTYRSDAGDPERREIERLRDRLRRRRKRAIKKLLKAARKDDPPAAETGSLQPAAPLADSMTIGEAARVIVHTRLADVLSRAPALQGAEDETLHAFRLACKQLRYALERLENVSPALSRADGVLKEIAQALGASRDCVVLAKRAAACEAPHVEARALRDRAAQLAHARLVWQDSAVALPALENV